jgi:DNA uptake protein ComE-like DNA-binding protein
MLLHQAVSVTNPFATRSGELSGKIDPNKASWYELAQLPGVGESLGRRIEKYRKDSATHSDRQSVFALPNDLLRIKGVGKTTLKRISPYLLWPSGSDPIN